MHIPGCSIGQSFPVLRHKKGGIIVVLKKRMCLWLVFAMLLAQLPVFGTTAKAAGGVAINSVNFPDSVVRNYVSNFDTSGNGTLEEGEIAAVKEFTIRDEGLTSLEGIECFTNMESFTCSGNMDICEVSSVDLSNLTALKYVLISNTKITSLDLSGHSALQSLYINQNYYLTSVDLSGCSALKSLGAYYTDLTVLDISSCPLLVDAYQNGSRIEERPEWVPSSQSTDIYPYYYRYKSSKGTLYVDMDVTVEVKGSVPVPDGWQKIDNVWYYYEDGSAVTGWKQISGKWYYFASGGAMQMGWQKISGKWYYFASGGAMQTGWQKISGKWYHFASGGAMQTGWQKIGNVWYYFNAGGDMATGWRTISGKTYYFKENGQMAAGEWCKGYWLNKDGTWTYPYKASWKQNSKGWYYQDTSGWYAKNQTVKIDGKNYTFDANGYMK